jgi:hypothetical protein
MRRARDEVKGKKFMVYLMGIVMVGSVFGVIFFGFGDSGGAASTEYNDFKFINRGTHWSTTVDGRQAFFTYLPDDLGFIFVDDNVINILRNKVQIDVASEFNDTFAEAISLAAFNMGLTFNNFNVFIRQGFATENEYNFPVITCARASTSVPVIYFRSSNETKVYLENDCIIAESSNQIDFERIKDKLVYGILGII